MSLAVRRTQKSSELQRFSGALDLVISPGVAFTTFGHRLGHGAGFYDRFFAEHERLFERMPARIGLALREQMVAAVPVDATDVKLDSIIHANAV